MRGCERPPQAAPTGGTHAGSFSEPSSTPASPSPATARGSHSRLCREGTDAHPLPCGYSILGLRASGTRDSGVDPMPESSKQRLGTNQMSGRV